MKLADGTLKRSGDILEFDTLQKIQVLGDTGTHLKPYPAPFWMPEPQFFILLEQRT